MAPASRSDASEGGSSVSSIFLSGFAAREYYGPYMVQVNIISSKQFLVKTTIIPAFKDSLPHGGFESRDPVGASGSAESRSGHRDERATRYRTTKIL